MPIAATQHIWFNGKLVPWEKATVHVLSHALHYGSSVFEGVRAYATPTGVAIFRLHDHTRRLFDSAKIYRIDIPFTPSEINAACSEVVAANGLKQRRLPAAGRIPRLRRDRRRAEDRPARGCGGGGLGMGQVPGRRQRGRRRRCLRLVLAARGAEHPSRDGQGCGQLPVEPADQHGSQAAGFRRGHRPGADGTVSEGAGENLFVIRDGVIYTPGFAHSVLERHHARHA